MLKAGRDNDILGDSSVVENLLKVGDIILIGHSWSVRVFSTINSDRPF